MEDHLVSLAFPLPSLVLVEINNFCSSQVSTASPSYRKVHRRIRCRTSLPPLPECDRCRSPTPSVRHQVSGSRRKPQCHHSFNSSKSAHQRPAKWTKRYVPTVCPSFLDFSFISFEKSKIPTSTSFNIGNTSSPADRDPHYHTVLCAGNILIPL